jgi:hypothetical protein
MEGEMLNATSAVTREIYQSVRGELKGIHYRLTVFRQFFTSQEAVDLVNRTAYFFFLMLRIDLLDTMVQAINRLLDPPKSLNIHDNASLEQLVDSLDSRKYELLISQLRSMLVDLRARSQRLKYWRDKQVSHRDLDVVLGQAPKPVTSLVEITDVFVGLQAFMNRFEGECQDPPVEHVFSGTVSPQEFAQNALEWERLKIDRPADYQNMVWADDGNTIIDLVRTAISPH